MAKFQKGSRPAGIGTSAQPTMGGAAPGNPGSGPLPIGQTVMPNIPAGKGTMSSSPVGSGKIAPGHPQTPMGAHSGPKPGGAKPMKMSKKTGTAY